jgi:hypothetical protein
VHIEVIDLLANRVEAEVGFHVYVSLGGPQRVTAMSIHRTQEGGGSFVAPLAVNARLTFVSVKPPRNQGARKLESRSLVPLSR